MKASGILLCLLALVGALTWPIALAAPDTPANDHLIGNNLIENGDFERGVGDPWLLCGGAQLIDAQAPSVDPALVHQGRYALRIGTPIDEGCGNGALGPAQVAAEDVTIPSDASDLTLAFWFAATGDWPAGQIELVWTTTPTAGTGTVAVVDSIRMDELLGGWQHYRQNLPAAALAAVRGQTLYLSIYVTFQGDPSWNWALYVDEVTVTATRQQTTASALPPAFQGDGTQPLLLTGPGSAADRYGLYRMDTDGRNRMRIADLPVAPRHPTWSPDGGQILFAVDDRLPAANPDPQKFPALIGAAYVMNGDGSNLRQIYRTTGREGIKEAPLGCLPTNSCRDRGTDAIDNLLTALTWAPDGERVLATVCSRARWYNGDKAPQDATCRLFIDAIPTPPTITTIGVAAPLVEFAESGSWQGNQILFDAAPVLADRAQGIWETTLSGSTPQTTQLVGYLTAYASSNTDLRGSPESVPVWAPDGRHFVTYRRSPSVHYTGLEDLAGGLRTNYAIMLHDRQNLANPRQLLLADHGQLVGQPAWSPAGGYLLYTLLSDDGAAADLWWLRVADGATGKVTNDGRSAAAAWHPTANEPAVAPTATPNPALTNRLYLPSVQSAVGVSAQPTLAGVVVTLPTLTPTPLPTALPTPANPTPVAPRGISGRVFDQGVGIAGIQVQLEVCGVTSCTVKARTTTTATGAYTFPDAPSASGIGGYHVTYRNGADGGNNVDLRYVQVWQSFLISEYHYGERVAGGDFEIVDLVTTQPADQATVTLPATFQWQRRQQTGERYQWQLDGIGDFGACDQATPSTATSYTFTDLTCTFPDVPTDTPLPWSVMIYSTDGGEGLSQPRTVQFAR